MKSKATAIEHPLWKRLCELDKRAARRFPSGHRDVGFGALGLILNRRLENGGYWCTPTNSLAFARTGGNGVHFSFLVRNGKVTRSSPVVVTIPCEFGQPNFIGGATLKDFLNLGYHRGYFAMETLASKKWFQPYSSAKWQPKEDRDYAVGYGVDVHQRMLLDYLIAELGLSPWTDLKRKFHRLQKQYLPRLELPRDDVTLTKYQPTIHK